MARWWGEYLLQCLRYVELNVVRCGVAKHPRDWAFFGYAELLGWPRRNRLLDLDKFPWLIGCSDATGFRKQFNAALDEATSWNDKPYGPKLSPSGNGRGNRAPSSRTPGNNHRRRERKPGARE